MESIKNPSSNDDYQSLQKSYIRLCDKPSDINEHLPTLFQYATECESILETGVRGCISSYALVFGLLNNKKSNRKILLNDITECDINNLLVVCKDLDVKIEYKWINNLQLDIKENVDLVFIDTWHIYGQLKRELEKFSKITNKYIIMHDTTVDGIYGEVHRYKHEYSEAQIEKMIIDSGFTREEIFTGLSKAIEEFLENNNDWVIKEIFINNNGLTILERVGLPIVA